jgi:hypothetical protein
MDPQESEATRHLAKPPGISFVGGLLIGASIMGAIVTVVLFVVAVTNIGEWATLWPALGAAVAGDLTYLGFSIGAGLLKNPPIERRKGERALWALIPVVWVILAVIVFVLLEGSGDAFLLAVTAGGGLFWSAVLSAPALYMRTSKVRSYYAALEGTAGYRS